MKLTEMYQQEPEGYQDLDDDNSRPKFRQTRKTRLTLKQINKLRKIQDVRNFEKEQKLKKIRKQYAPAPAEGGGLPGL